MRNLMIQHVVRCSRATHCVMVSTCLIGMLFLPSVSQAQRIDAPQARILHEVDELTVQALAIGEGHLIVTNSEGGLIKSLLLVQPYGDAPYGLSPEASVDRRANMSRAGRSQRFARQDGLEVAGSRQRIMGISFDDDYMYVVVGGHPNVEDIQDAIEFGDVSSDRIADNDDESIGDDTVGDDTVGDASLSPDDIVQEEWVRVMLHVYDYRISTRVFSHEVYFGQSRSLSDPMLTAGPLTATETGVAVYGWEFDLTDDRYIAAIAPDGDEQSLPTAQTQLRMRDV